MRKTKISDICGNQRGSALVETAIVVPVLFLFLMGIIDLSRFFIQYSRASVIAYEGARYGAGRPMLEAGSYGPVQDGSKTIHQKVHDRIGILFQKVNSIPGPAQVVTTYDSAANENSIEVRIETPFNAIFPLMRSLASVRVSATAPYLIDPA